MSLEKMYFALAPKNCDVSAVMEMRPKNLLLSYALWAKEKYKYKLSNIVEGFWKENYHPNIMLDSGAYSFRDDSQEYSFLSLIMPIVYEVYCDNNFELNSGFDSIEDCLVYYIELIQNNELKLYYSDLECEKKLLKDYPNFLAYLNFIQENYKYIDTIVALDDVNNEKNSKDNWYITKLFFENAIPTFHYKEDISTLEYYINNGASYVGLGSIAIEKKKPGVVFKDLIEWINNCSFRYPCTKFHIFGCQDNKLLNKSIAYSADGTAWIKNAGQKAKKLKELSEFNNLEFDSVRAKFEFACEEIRKKEV